VEPGRQAREDKMRRRKKREREGFNDRCDPVELTEQNERKESLRYELHL